MQNLSEGKASGTMTEANSSSKNRSIPGAGAEQLAELFHSIYERLAPEFGYTTRTDTRRFDRGTENGKLMIAVCDEILTWFDRQDKDYAAVVIANAEIANINVEQAETIERLREAIQWVVTDASYKPPEQIDAIVTERWIARLRSALQSESRDG